MLAEDLSIEEVRRLIDEGAGVNRLERPIERLELEPEDAAALWLAAWSSAGRDNRRQHVPGLYFG